MDETVGELSIDEARDLVRGIVQLARMAQRVLPDEVSPLTARLRRHLGIDPESVVSAAMTVPPVEQVNVQIAFDALEEVAERWEVIGMPADIGNYGGISLATLVARGWHGPGEAACQYTSIDIDDEQTVRCLRAGIVLTVFDGVPVAAFTHQTERFDPEVVLEVVAAEPAVADRFIERIKELMRERNAFRGRTIAFTFSRHGSFGLEFVRLPAVQRADVVLAPGELDAIEHHAIGISDHAVALRSADQHVKRGLLLYGPPGTGKTHTIAYLVGAMPGRTTIILAGAAVQAVGQAGTIARELQPATVVIEDVDLIGMDRDLPGGEHNALLFQLLNEMDGLAGDADVLFVLTTNRVEMLEEALAARPGRVDQAIELSLPNADARERLLELYTGGAVPVDERAVIDRLDGVAPAFIKELARRAELLRLRLGRDAPHPLTTALDEMLTHSTPVLRRALAGTDG